MIVPHCSPVRPSRSGANRQARSAVRALSSALVEDHSLAPDIARVGAAIRSGELVARVEDAVGELA